MLNLRLVVLIFVTVLKAEINTIFSLNFQS
jgi:hypothetical protein